MSFSTLYVGATGVIAHGDRMQVVANNLANVSTVGYKKADAQFGDLMSRNLGSGNAQYAGGAHYASQIGSGVAVSEIRNIFTEGGIENTNTFSDLAITGNGFFGIRKPTGEVTTGASHYTRAGAFRFNKDAYMTDPHDYRLQGYAINRETGEVATTVSDIQLPYEDIIIHGHETRVIRSEPLPTSQIEMVTTLDALDPGQFHSDTQPFFALLESYNGQHSSNAAGPFGNTLPAYSSAISVYDEDGNERDLTIYFDPVNTNTLSNATPGYSYWEYVVALPPNSDGSDAYGGSAAGLAGLGVMTFDGNGQLVNHMAYELNAASSAGGKDLGSWVPATFSDTGEVQFTYTFGSNGSTIGTERTVSYDFGLTSGDGTWRGGTSNAAGVGIYANRIGGLGDMQRDARASTSFNTGSATIYQVQNGYTWGYLEYAQVNQDGVLSGAFSNGQTEDFYKIALYRFNSEWGLRRDGANNFLATEASGEGMDGIAQLDGRGTVMQNTLEMSNVDMAEEFAKMIVTQRGYQANTKVITTGDSLLNTTISIKR